MEKKSLGIIYAVLAPFCFSVYFISSKAGLDYYNVLTIFVLWFGSASVFSFLMILSSKKLNEYRKLRGHWKYIALSMVMFLGSTITSFYAISIIGSSLTSFLQKMSTVILVFLGVVFLKEKFNKYEVLSGLAIMSGVFLISFSKGEYILIGVVVLIIHAISHSLARFIVKSRLGGIDPLILVNVRAFFLVVTVFIFAAMTGKLEFHVSNGLYFVTFPSIFSAVLGQLFTFKAYKLIDLSKVTLIAALGPFLVYFAAYFIFHEILTPMQFFGGMIIIGGVVGLILFRKRVIRKNSIY